MIARPPDPVERYRLARRDVGLVVVEGFHALKHAVRFGAQILDARTADAARLAGLVAELAPDMADGIRDLALPIDRELFSRLAPSPHPTGVIAIARRPAIDVQAVLGRQEPGPVVFLERPTHHGNIGAVVRVAAAAGAGAVLVTGDRDPWHPAAVRGGAGLQFALPVGRVDSLPLTDRPIVALDPTGEPAGAGPIPRRSVLVFGSERTGLSGALLHRADLRVAIPMAAGVSSLNLATAVTAVLYAYVPG